MHFIVQQNLLSVIDFDRLKAAIKTVNLDHTFIKVIPFNYEYVEGEPYPGFFKTLPVFAMGSTTLMRIAQNMGWMPGVLDGPNFTYASYIEHYGDDMLNSDAQYFRFKDVPKFRGLKFIRPVKDNKAFAGSIVDGVEFEAWQQLQLETGVTVFPETQVMVAEPTHIDAEYRFFVVGGKVVTGSMYVYRQRLAPRELEPEFSLDMMAQAYAQRMVNHWQPADAFVIDVAATDMQESRFKIIEINGINAAGFYKSDVTMILNAIEKFYQ
jgi:ATP-grasp domain-containing protein